MKSFNLSYWLKLLTLITVWCAGVALVVELSEQLLTVAVAIFVAICLNPPVTFFSRKVTRENRLAATILVYVLLAAIIVFAVLNILPIFVSQVVDLVESIPELYQKLAATNSPLGRSLTELDIGKLIQDNRDKILNAVSSLSGDLISVAASIFGGIAKFVTIMSFAFLMVLHSSYWRRLFLRFIPERQHKDLLPLSSQMYRVATNYINGNLVISLIAGTASTLMLSLLGVPNAVALGLIVALVDLLPSIGATLAGVIVVTLTLLLTGVGDAVVMAIFFLAYQGIENVTLQPLIYSKALRIQPLIILLAVYLVGSLFGLVGALLAIPLTACTQIMVEYFYDKHQKQTSQKRRRHVPKTA